MKRFNRTLLALVLAAAVLPVFADAPGPQPGDPARWYQPDVSAQDRYRTAMKEAGAALKEALVDCRQLPPGERDSCVREARERNRADTESAREQNLRRP